MEGEWTDDSRGNGEWKGWEETEHKLHLWMRTMGDGERAEGGMGTWWRGAMEGEKMRNICNNMDNKDLFKKIKYRTL